MAKKIKVETFTKAYKVYKKRNEDKEANLFCRTPKTPQLKALDISEGGRG